jgi:integrase
VGDFYDIVWKYKGINVPFVELSERAASQRPLVDCAGLLARCTVVESVTADRCVGHTRAQLRAFRELQSVIGDSVEAWSCIDARQVDQVLLQIQSRPRSSQATCYNRACALVLAVRYVSTIRQTVQGSRKSFAFRPVVWRNPLKNPTRALEDPTTEEFAEHRRRKYENDLETAVGRLRMEALNHPELEPKSGYSRIRIESLSFLMALGIRSGELLTLSSECFTDRTDGDQLAIRVWTEKGALPGVRTVPSIWREAILSSHAFLVAACSEARARARLIETSGFTWIQERLEARRKQVGLPDPVARALQFSGHLDNMHFTLDEVCGCLQMSPKLFSEGGRYHAATEAIIGTSVASIVDWLDSRFEWWDWIQYARPRHEGRNAGKGRLITVTEVGVLSGAPRSEMTKLADISKPVASILEELRLAGSFEEKHHAGAGMRLKRRMRAKWAAIRRDILCPGRRRTICVVDIHRFCNLLHEQYGRNLERHYGENLEHGRFLVAEGARSSTRSYPLSEHLLVVWEDQFNAAMAEKGFLPRPVNRAELYNFLATNSAKRTAFDLYNIRNSRGEIISASPHQIRHWLTTAFLRAGAAETVVDVWMGRTPGQSRQYDHRTLHERAEQFRERYMKPDPPLDYLGLKVIQWRNDGFQETEIEELVVARLQVLHFVPWGQCSRDLVMAPCDKALMCLRGFGTNTVCKSFHIDPQDEAARLSVVDLRRRYASQLMVFEPNFANLKRTFDHELGTATALDQHVAMMVAVVAGCDAVLEAYTAARSSKRTDPLRVIEASSCVTGS